jgi:plasmid stability protein
MHYTPQQIPGDIEQALRARAAAEHKSVDAALLDALARGLGIEQQMARVPRQADRTEPPNGRKRDLSDIAGTWVVDPETEAILEEQNQIDPELWQ